MKLSTNTSPGIATHCIDIAGFVQALELLESAGIGNVASRALDAP